METYPSIRCLGYDIFSGKNNFFSNGFKGVINTLNPHSYIVARRDKKFSKALKEGDILIADGIGITMAVRVLTGSNIERIPGSDLHALLISSLGSSGGTSFYLGSSDETLKKIRERLEREYPGIQAGFFSPPFRPVFSIEENLSIISKINEYHPDILFVGMTAPKQEKWVYENRHLIHAKIICSIGAVFDFYAGTVKRPGKFWISLGLEWLPRFLKEPRRLWRRNLISTPLFIWFVLVEKVRLIFKQGSGEKSR